MAHHAHRTTLPYTPRGAPNVAGPGHRGAASTVRRLAAVVAALAATSLAAGCGDGEESPTSTTAPTAEAATTPCPPADGSAERRESFDGPPATCIDPEANDYTATFVTSEGTFTATLDPAAAPGTVNNFVVLARYQYYDGTPIHRVVPGFVIQGGDGDGEPLGVNDLGYTIEDELPATSEQYLDYSLAMANAGPDTNGSQFFVVLPGGGDGLAPSFSLFGEVVEGREVIDAVAALGTAGRDGPPSSEVVVESVTITETPR